MGQKRLVEIPAMIPEDQPPPDEAQIAIQAAEYGSDVPTWDAHAEATGQNLPMPEIMRQIELFIDREHVHGQRKSVQALRIVTGHGTIYQNALEHIRALQGKVKMKGVKPVDYILQVRGHELGGGETNAVIYVALAPNA